MRQVLKAKQLDMAFPDRGDFENVMICLKWD
jgi:hypothetical protein